MSGPGQHQSRPRTIVKRCSCQPLGVVVTCDPGDTDQGGSGPAPVSGVTVTTTLLTPPPLQNQQQSMKKCCSCEPGGPLCYLDPMTSYDWSSRPRRDNCDLSIRERWLQWKVDTEKCSEFQRTKFCLGCQRIITVPYYNDSRIYFCNRSVSLCIFYRNQVLLQCRVTTVFN